MKELRKSFETMLPGRNAELDDSLSSSDVSQTGVGSGAQTGCDVDEPTARNRIAARSASSTSIRRGATRWLASGLMTVAALFGALVIWNYYVTSPWTRDGRIRVQVASVAPQVSGQITEVRVVDNEYVRKGDVLYIIDPFNFQNALEGAKTQVQMRAADMQVKQVQAERRQKLSTLSTTAEEQQIFVGSATQAEAAFKAAQVQLALTEINLERTRVRSPVNGFITNLLLRAGDFAREGVADVSVIDAESYWVDGYFEETKMPGVCVGDAAEVKLMGYRRPIIGEVNTVTRGISVSDAAPSTQGLPNVDPVYTWVRLAQRVPVRIRIVEVPAGVPLVSGMTATVSIRSSAGKKTGTSWEYQFGDFASHLFSPFGVEDPRPGCVPVIGVQKGVTTTIETPKPTKEQSPSQINPGLASGMTEAPTHH